VCLLTVRHTLHWKPNLFKDILLTRLNKIPKVRKFLVSQWGYKCKKLVREKSDHPDGYWEIKDYKFLN